MVEEYSFLKKPFKVISDHYNCSLEIEPMTEEDKDYFVSKIKYKSEEYIDEDTFNVPQIAKILFNTGSMEDYFYYIYRIDFNDREPKYVIMLLENWDDSFCRYIDLKNETGFNVIIDSIRKYIFNSRAGIIKFTGSESDMVLMTTRACMIEIFYVTRNYLFDGREASYTWSNYMNEHLDIDEMGTLVVLSGKWFREINSEDYEEEQISDRSIINPFLYKGQAIMDFIDKIFIGPAVITLLQSSLSTDN